MYISIYITRAFLKELRNYILRIIRVWSLIFSTRVNLSLHFLAQFSVIHRKTSSFDMFFKVQLHLSLLFHTKDFVS